jgi:hypothetical protein
MKQKASMNAPLSCRRCRVGVLHARRAARMPSSLGHVNPTLELTRKPLGFPFHPPGPM